MKEFDDDEIGDMFREFEGMEPDENDEDDFYSDFYSNEEFDEEANEEE